MNALKNDYFFSLPIAVLFYAISGFIHELAHVSYILYKSDQNEIEYSFGLLISVITAMLSRAFDVSALGCYDVGCRVGFDVLIDQSRIVGAVVSCFLAFGIWVWTLGVEKKKNATERSVGNEKIWRACAYAFSATAFDAVCTDVLFARFLKRTSMLCGNFGIVLLNFEWARTTNGKSAYDLIEKMINVTMMRGAQSGGVVTFEENGKGIRSRVVNMKRTDLSKLLRKKTEKDSGGRRIGHSKKTRVFCGHTRFATSSKATFDGTHPHQWSPAQILNVYELKQTKPGSQRKSVENFITHNGDFDALKVNKKWCEVNELNHWLKAATKFEAPSAVDSASIAGVVDLLRAQGSFTLACRYAVCFALRTSDVYKNAPIPTLLKFEEIGKVFEKVLDETLLASGTMTVNAIGFDLKMREKIITEIIELLNTSEKAGKSSLECLHPNYIDEESGASVQEFVRASVHAFFDNDSLFVMKYFLTNAKGSFGLMITNSLDAHRQLCLAARGQTMSIAFYPKKGLICYGSEQAAVKAGLSIETPRGDILASVHGGQYGDDNAAVRLDLDDLNGEICLLDWGEDKVPAVSYPNSHLEQYPLMMGSVTAVLATEGNMSAAEQPTQMRKKKSMENMSPRHAAKRTVNVDKKLFHRMTRLEGNELIKMLPKESKDPVLEDIKDIPRICKDIQDDWRNNPQGSMSLNRFTAWNLGKCLKRRLQRRVDKTTSSEHSYDVVLTGCEVSLWLAEQFASDLQTAFPRLRVKAISSNKILALFGQDISMPAIGFSNSKKTDDFTDAVVIIVSHSGGTFAPLATSNLLMSSTSSIFVVASEWDTQIGKQLRALKSNGMFDSRIFSTNCGVRPSEPCSVSVAATQQLLTQIFLHMSLVILDNTEFRKYTNAFVTKHDLSELEKCNQMNIDALSEIVGCDTKGDLIPSQVEDELRKQGHEWSQHVLEGVKGWIMSFIYIVATVTAGYPLITGVATLCGLSVTWAFYITRFFDSLIYIFLPQINITIIRLIQKRNLLHRMTARTVVIGDIPWVAQAADAFLSKIFACSYSAAGITVLSGNPSDHLVHRHTHRVVRGALLVVGRPDGRLSALTTAEATTSLSLSQASSIQSFGGTCESITIGHSPYKLPLSKHGIYLNRHRPLYLCEKYYEEQRNNDTTNGKSAGALLSIYSEFHDEHIELSVHKLNKKNAVSLLTDAHRHVEEQRGHLRSIFNEVDTNKDGRLCLSEFTTAYKRVDKFNKNSPLTDAQITKLFRNADTDKDGELDYEEFSGIVNLSEIVLLKILEAEARNAQGLLMVEASHEEFFGQALRKSAPMKVKPYTLIESQEFSMRLYESRIASMQRFISMTVMFHEMGSTVERFWRFVSFGYLGYRIDRTHSIMRIATTASPVSGAEVRARKQFIALVTAFNSAVSTIRRVHFEFTEGVQLSRKRILRRQSSTTNNNDNSGSQSDSYVDLIRRSISND